jgi:hypothetical protein
MTITAAQCRAARALTEVTREILSQASGISEGDIKAFEKKLSEPDEAITSALAQALEGLGAVFMADDAHGGAGVRLKFTLSEAERIASLENEGGPVGEDAVAD